MLAIGVNLSAFFILAANSFMQHPVGVIFNPHTHRAELTSIWALLTNSTALVTFPHVIAGSWLVAGGFVLVVSAWHLGRKDREVDVFRPAFRLGVVAVLAAGLAVVVSGHLQGQIMVKQQPMKMAAAEALCNTEKGAGLSLFAVGRINASCDEVKSVTVPGLLSFMSNDDPDSTVQGVNDLQREAVAKYGAGNYIPNLPVTYWSFRLMIGLGLLTFAIGFAGLWLSRRGRIPDSRWFRRAAVLTVVAPFFANSFGWLFTEMGRQPWVVVPNPTGVFAVRMLTTDGVSPTVGTATVLTSLITFTLVYAALAVVELRLLVHYVKAGPAAAAISTTEHGDGDPDRPMAFAY
jgi:cytochrome d ubiquinol oxidase subunit I